MTLSNPSAARRARRTLYACMASQGDVRLAQRPRLMSTMANALVTAAGFQNPELL